MKAQTNKRNRDPLSPKPILDRAVLLKSLERNRIELKNGQLDLFYQLLHRSGYPPLKEFVTELVRGGGRGDGMGFNDDDDDDDYEEHKEDDSIVLLPNHHHHLVSPKFRTKNSVSSRPGRSSQRQQFPKSFLSYLATNTDEFATLTSRVQLHKTSKDGSTTKLAVELQDGHVVESVLMRHEGRVTICVSSQVGCAMGCTFCATGTMGIRGNLSSGEILEQLVHGSRILASSSSMDTSGDGHLGMDAVIFEENNCNVYQKERRLDLIRNVVFMGMGEPLNNYANVLAACRALIDRRLWNLAHNHVTVSTVGVPSRMRDLSRDLPEVNLALSLHAPNQSMREKIVPAAKGTPIESLIDALDEHMMALAKRKLNNQNGGGVKDGINAAAFTSDERQSASKKKRAMIEYVMLEGDTSTVEAAHQLGKLCEGRHLVVNLIPYNKTNVKDKLSCPTEEHMQEFRRIVSSYGSFCSIRRTMGADIAGACGQLVVEEEEKRQNTVIDIEDGPFHKEESRKPSIPSKGHDRRSDNILYEDASCIEKVDPWLQRLTIATAVVASCFVVSSTALLLQKRNRN